MKRSPSKLGNSSSKAVFRHFCGRFARFFGPEMSISTDFPISGRSLGLRRKQSLLGDHQMNQPQQGEQLRRVLGQELVADLVQTKAVLGKDPAKGGKFVLDEAQTGTRIERQLGIYLRGDPSGNGDWIRYTGQVLDSASPPPSQFFNDKTFAQWKNSIQSHLNKQGVNSIVVDPVQRGLSSKQIKKISDYIDGLPPAQRAKIIFLK